MGLHVYPFRRVVRHLRERGVDPAPLLGAAGLSEELLEHENRWFQHDQYHRFLHASVEATSDPAFGVRLAQGLGRGSAGLFGYCFIHQPTVRAAVGMAETYLPCFRMGLQVERPEESTVVFRIDGGHPGMRIEMQELVCLAVRLASIATKGQFVPVAVHLKDAIGDEDIDWKSIVGVEPTLGAEFDGVVMDPSALDLAFPDADEELLKHLMRAAEHHIADLRQSVGQDAGIIALQGCAIDLTQGVVRRGGETIGLTTKERQLLRFMSERPNQLVTQVEIESEVWQIRGAVVTHAPAVAVRRLRQKIEVDPRHPVNLVTVRGEGWKLQMSGAWQG